MAQLPSAFNATQHEDMNDYSTIPEGDYMASIVKSEMKDTRNGDGKYLNIQLKVIGGKYNGRTLFTMLNLINNNATAVEIAQKELATICRACGKVQVADSNELHGIPMLVSVGIVPATAKYKEKNEITMYKPANGAPAPVAQSAPATVAGVNGAAAAQPEVPPEQPAQPAVEQKRPWD